MNTQEFKNLVKTEFRNFDLKVETFDDSGEGDGEEGYEHRYKIRLYTNDYIYSIIAIDGKQGGRDKSYLGCVVSSRKMRPGETWHRGNDLSDGKLCIETWNKIKNDIIGYELVDLAPKTAAAEEIKILQKAGFNE